MEILKQIYGESFSAVRMDGRFSEFFRSVQGVQQGDPISPLLFILYIAKVDLEDEDDPVIDGRKVPFLLLADDLSFFSCSWLELQRKS